METKLCQSCGMPMHAHTDFGTNADGNQNSEYCTYCYQRGEFTKDLNMEEMIQQCVKYLNDFNKDSENKLTKEEAIQQMRSFFPTLKRWKN